METYYLTGIIIGIIACLIVGFLYLPVTKYLGAKRWCLVFFLGGSGLFAGNVEIDTITMQRDLQEIVITSGKETNEMRRLPGSISFITPRMINERKIRSIVDLSTITPNFFIPNYGSKMSTPVYIRGIGERSTGQAIGLYVDNMPYFNQSVFNFDFLDVQQIEVLRGPQGTLYGRNAMSGIINIFTHSPLDEERTRLMLSGGNHGLFRANATVSKIIGANKNAGIALSGYYDQNNGFFENQFDGKRADFLRSGGGRLRLDWRPIFGMNIQWINSYEYSGQGAFPYGIYTNGEITQPNYDFAGKYNREKFSSHLNFMYRNHRLMFNSTSAIQHFNDNMNMDLDYTPLPYFTLNQRQNETNFTQELTLKSNTSGNLRWVVGAFGFHQNRQTNVVTTMGKTGIDSILQPIFNNMPPMIIRVTDTQIPMPGLFKTPVHGGALFSESTINNLLFKGLSFTMGSRLDFEKTTINYNTSMVATLDVIPPRGAPTTLETSTNLVGNGSMTFWEFLPKFALKYEFNDRHYIYSNVARGYKAGGYNIQLFADIVQNMMSQKRNTDPIPQEHQDSIIPLISYNPEYSWNYEIGFKGEILKDRLFAEFAAFYIDVNDVLITQFVQSGRGRMLKNAGRAESLGAELALRAYLFDGFTMSASYGFTRATFKDYQTGADDFSGNFIPFAPQYTFSFATSYTRQIRNSRWIERFNLDAQYNGAGKIYWTEANDVYQRFYGLLNLKAGATKGIFNINIWTKNTLNTTFTAFYFDSMFGRFGQQGNPFQIGIDLAIRF